MADNKPKITYGELVNSNFTINKKLVMIDSRSYTDEAFKYILGVADSVGSIVFVYDTKKIYANGQFFGGDAFVEDLLYFTSITTLNNRDGQDTMTGEIYARKAQDALVISGKDYLEVKSKYDYNNYQNVLEFKYNLDDAVLKDLISVDNESFYNLDVINGQVKLNKYTPLKVEIISPEIREYDSDDAQDVLFDINLTGTHITNVFVENIGKYELSIEPEELQNLASFDAIENKIKFTTIPENTDVTVSITASDGITTVTSTGSQKWGYGIYYGVQHSDSIDSLKSFDLDTLHSSYSKEILSEYNGELNIEINQNSNEYGIFICPASLNVTFKDTDNNLIGGWTPSYMLDKNLYSKNIPYIVYVTDNDSIGRVKWNIKLES